MARVNRKAALLGVFAVIPIVVVARVAQISRAAGVQENALLLAAAVVEIALWIGLFFVAR